MRLSLALNWRFFAGEADARHRDDDARVHPTLTASPSLMDTNQRLRAPPASTLACLIAAPQTPQRETRAPPVAWVNNLPNPLELTEAGKFDYFAQWCAKGGVDAAALPLEHRVVLGMRVTTKTTASSTHQVAGRGIYDDLLVVLWREQDKDGNIRKRVRQFIGNTEPSAQYVKAMVNKVNEDGLTIHDRREYSGGDSNGDGKNEAGRLPDGRYIYERAWKKNFGGDILRPRASILVERDTNHDGLFDTADAKLVSDYKASLIKSGYPEPQAQAIIDRGRDSLRTIYFHRGGQLVKDRSGKIIAQNTGSAGCQTMPPATFARFWEALGNQRESGQTTFEYVLITVTSDE